VFESGALRFTQKFLKASVPCGSRSAQRGRRHPRLRERACCQKKKKDASKGGASTGARENRVDWVKKIGAASREKTTPKRFKKRCGSFAAMNTICSSLSRVRVSLSRAGAEGKRKEKPGGRSRKEGTQNDGSAVRREKYQGLEEPSRRGKMRPNGQKKGTPVPTEEKRWPKGRLGASVSSTLC